MYPYLWYFLKIAVCKTGNNLCDGKQKQKEKGVKKNRLFDRGIVLVFLLAARAATGLGAEAEIKVDHAGRPVLIVDGAPMPLLPGLTGFGAGGDGKDLSAFWQAGLKEVVVFANLGLFQSKLGYVSPIKHMREFWRGPGEYDASDVDKILSTPLKVNPDSKLIIWLGIGEYLEFGSKYPDEIIRNEKGEALIASTHFLRFDSAPPNTAKQEHYASSFFSERYRKECAEMLVEFIKTVEASPYGKNVIGYLIGGGQDAQLYSWSPPNGLLYDKPENWGDYSPAARKAFIAWVQKKYEGDLSKLNKAWGAELSSFEQVTPPPSSDLAGVNPFHDPVKEYKAYDWKRFLAEGRAELLDGFASTIKKASNKKIVVGASGGDGGHRRDNTSISRLLRSNNLDFFLHQAAYAVRIPPSCGGINALLDSYTVNGKLFLTDMDHRLWTGRKVGGTATIGVVSFTDVSVGRAADMAMQRDMWRREYARLWVSGNNGAWFNNMGSSSEYDNAEIQDEMRFLNDFSTKLIERRCASSLTRSIKNILTNPEPAAPAEVVFVNDEEAVDYARGALGEFHGAGMFLQWNEANVSGVPIRYYYAQDLRDGKIPPAKLYVLQNCLDIDAVMARRIRELRKSGATIVLLQGTGMVQLAREQTDFLDDALGICLRQLETPEQGKEKSPNGKIEAGHPMLVGNEWNDKLPSLNNEKLKEVKGITLTVKENTSSVLARYPTSGSPAAAADDKSKVVFIGAYTLSRDAISRLAAYAGAWRVTPPGNAIAADSEILMIHPLTDGKVELTLKKAAALWEVPPGSLTSAKALTHTVELKAGKTYLFEQRQALPEPVPSREPQS